MNFTANEAAELWGVSRQCIEQRAAKLGLGRLEKSANGKMMRVYTRAEVKFMEPSPVGRPIGYVMSQASKDAISRAHKERHRSKG